MKWSVPKFIGMVAWGRAHLLQYLPHHPHIMHMVQQWLPSYLVLRTLLAQLADGMQDKADQTSDSRSGTGGPTSTVHGKGTHCTRAWAPYVLSWGKKIELPSHGRKGSRLSVLIVGTDAQDLPHPGREGDGLHAHRPTLDAQQTTMTPRPTRLLMALSLSRLKYRDAREMETTSSVWPCSWNSRSHSRAFKNASLSTPPCRLPDWLPEQPPGGWLCKARPGHQGYGDSGRKPCSDACTQGPVSIRVYGTVHIIHVV